MMLANWTTRRWKRCVFAPCVATGWRKSRGCGAIFKDQSPDDIRMAGAISARWMGRVEGQAVVWKTAQTECARPAMGLQDRYGEESVATEVCVRAMDARHGGQADQGQVWRRVERQFGWSVVGATRHHLPEAFVSCAGARRGSGRAMAQEEISEDQGAGAAGKSGDLLWRCRPHALGSSRGAQLGPEGRNGCRGSDGRAPWTEPHLGYPPARPDAVHDQGQRRRQRRCFHRISQAPHYRCQARDFLDRRSRPCPYRQKDQSICREPERPAAVVLSSALLARPQSR